MAASVLRELVEDILVAAGSARDVAAVVATSLLEAERSGHRSHGLLRVADYLAGVRRGAIDPGASPRVVPTGELGSMVDGCRAFGPVVVQAVVAELRRRLQTAEVAVVGVRGCAHLGRLADVATPVCRDGHVVLGFATYLGAEPKVAPWGACEPVFGTNPLVVGVPGERAPVVADLTTSAVSEGKIRTYARDHRPVPRGWLIDRDWAPVTDAAQLYGSPRTASIAPLGDGVGYKGFALAFAAEVIGGILTGLGHAGPQPPREDGNAATFVALRSELLGRPLASIRRDVERLVEHCESRPVAEGFASVRVPGRHEGGAMPTELEIDETTLDELERLRRAPDDCEAS